MAEEETLNLSYSDPIELSLFTDLNATCVRSHLFNDTLNPHWKLFRRYTTNPATISFQVIMLIAGLLLNGFVVTVLVRKISRRPFYLLLLNLAAVDLCIAMISIGFNVVIGSVGLHNIGSSDFLVCQICKLSILFVCLKLVSVFTLCLLAMDRFVWFYSPARYNKATNVGTAALAITAIWILSTIYLIPPMTGYGDSVFVIPCGPVFLTDLHVHRSAAYLMAVGISVLMVVLILVATTVVVWGKTVRILKVNSCRTLPEEDSDPMKQIIQKKIKTEIKQQLKLYSIFGGIFIVDVATYIIAIPLLGYLTSALYYQLLDAALIDVLLQTILHPLVIGFLVPELHDVYFKRVWACLCKKALRGDKEENKVQEDLDEKRVVVDGDEKIKNDKTGLDERKVVESEIKEDNVAIEQVKPENNTKLDEQKVKRKFKLFGRKNRGDSVDKNVLEKSKNKEAKDGEGRGDIEEDASRTKEIEEKVEDKTELDEQKVIGGVVAEEQIKSEDKNELEKEAMKVKEDEDKVMTVVDKKEGELTLPQKETQDGKRTKEKRKLKLFGRKEKVGKEDLEKAPGKSKDDKDEKSKKEEGKGEDLTGKEKIEETKVEDKTEEKVTVIDNLPQSEAQDGKHAKEKRKLFGRKERRGKEDLETGKNKEGEKAEGIESKKGEAKRDPQEDASGKEKIEETKVEQKVTVEEVDLTLPQSEAQDGKHMDEKKLKEGGGKEDVEKNAHERSEEGEKAEGKESKKGEAKRDPQEDASGKEKMEETKVEQKVTVEEVDFTLPQSEAQDDKHANELFGRKERGGKEDLEKNVFGKSKEGEKAEGKESGKEDLVKNAPGKIKEGEKAEGKESKKGEDASGKEIIEEAKVEDKTELDKVTVEEKDFTLPQSEAQDGKYMKEKRKLFGRKEKGRKGDNASGKSKEGEKAEGKESNKGEAKGDPQEDVSGKEKIKETSKTKLDEQKLTVEVDHALPQSETQDSKDIQGKRKFKLFGRKREKSKEKGVSDKNAFGKSEDGERIENLNNEDKERGNSSEDASGKTRNEEQDKIELEGKEEAKKTDAFGKDCEKERNLNEKENENKEKSEVNSAKKREGTEEDLEKEMSRKSGDNIGGQNVDQKSGKAEDIN